MLIQRSKQSFAKLYDLENLKLSWEEMQKGNKEKPQIIMINELSACFQVPMIKSIKKKERLHT